eukprot:1331824-Rhodomonas_salina.2
MSTGPTWIVASRYLRLPSWCAKARMMRNAAIMSSTWRYGASHIAASALSRPYVDSGKTHKEWSACAAPQIRRSTKSCEQHSREGGMSEGRGLLPSMAGCQKLPAAATGARI